MRNLSRKKSLDLKLALRGRSYYHLVAFLSYVGATVTDLQDGLRDEIIEFLRQLAWPIEAVSKRAIKTYYCGYFGNHEIIVHISHKDICIIIDPVLIKPQESWRESVVRLILAMGKEIRHVNIGLDDDGDLYIKVHLPAEHLNLERFQCLLQGLCQVAENIIIPVLQANAFDNLMSE